LPLSSLSLHRGIVQHIAENGLTPDEVDEVLWAADEIGASASSGSPIVVGVTSTGKSICVVFEIIEEAPFAVRVVTAFETEF
jgi:hypothetical protein